MKSKKRKVVIIREEDSKREKGKNETKNDCTTVTELEPNEEMWDTLNISEIKKSTCNIRGIRMFIEVIFEKLHQYFEKIQIKGISNRCSIFSEATPASIITIPLWDKKGGASCNILEIKSSPLSPAANAI